MDPNIVVIEVSGGVCQEVYTDAPVRVVLVDWDNIDDGGIKEAGSFPLTALAEMPASTAAVVGAALEAERIPPTP